MARHQGLPIEWAEKGVRKEDDLRPSRRRREKRNRYAVYFILKSLEQGPTFRSRTPKDPTADPHDPILAKPRSRFTHDSFYLRHPGLGPMVLRAASFFPFQTPDDWNGHRFIEPELNRQGASFRKNDHAFRAVADPEALQAAADARASRARPSYLPRRREERLRQAG